MYVVRQMCDTFWNPEIWLPPNVTWSDLVPNEEVEYTDYRHLLIPLNLAVVFLILRYCLERYWFAPVGLSLGIKNTKGKKPRLNPILEKAYLRCGKMTRKQILYLSKQLAWNERQVERWLRLRRLQDKPATLTKFCETSWRWLYYSGALTYGLMCLWDKPWLWDISLVYYGYPHYGVTNDVWWYYMFSLAFYWSSAMSLFFYVKRKDFWEMCIHHIATICLLNFSWVCNMHRLGALVLLIHDSSDAFLESAKLAKCAHFQRLCDALYVAFAIIWITTRCCIYPFWIIHSTIIEAPKVIPMFPAYYIFNSLLLLLLGLHISCTHVIVKIAYKAIYTCQMEGDIHSCSSDDEDSDATNDHT